MSNQNEDIKNESGGNNAHTPEHKHQSWLGHIVEEVREKFDELVEEAQNSMNDGGFSALGNGQINVVHDHHHDHDKTADEPAAQAETPKEEKKGEQPQGWFSHVVGEVREKIDEMVEEAENTMNDGTFSALGNGKVNVVHDHHHDHDAEKK